MTTPFYQLDSINNGVIFNGTCGFKIAAANTTDGTELHILRVLPLEFQQKPGDFQDGNELVENAGEIQLAFASPESIDAMISSLKVLRNTFPKKKRVFVKWYEGYKNLPSYVNVPVSVPEDEVKNWLTRNYNSDVYSWRYL